MYLLIQSKKVMYISFPMAVKTFQSSVLQTSAFNGTCFFLHYPIAEAQVYWHTTLFSFTWEFKINQNDNTDVDYSLLSKRVNVVLNAVAVIANHGGGVHLLIVRGVLCFLRGSTSTALLYCPYHPFFFHMKIQNTSEW